MPGWRYLLQNKWQKYSEGEWKIEIKMLVKKRLVDYKSLSLVP